MIDHRYRIIFVHQRKVAGTSIMTALGHPAKTRDRDAYNSGVLSRGWGDRDRSYFVFSAVRNPFDRLISSWKYLPATRERSLPDVLRNPPQEGADFRHFTRQQVQLLRDRATGNLVTDDLIRFESLQEDFDRICRRIGAPGVVLPHVNRSRRERGYRDYFDAETRALAETLFADDLETFGYAF